MSCLSDNIPVRNNLSKKTLFKLLLILISSFLVIILSLFFYIQTDNFNTHLQKIVLKQINSHWADTSLKIEKIEGNILKGITLRKISLNSGINTIVSIDSCYISYSLTKILKREILIKEIAMNQLKINLIQNNDHSWNIENLIPSTGERSAMKTSSPSSWKLMIKDISLINTNITIESGILNEIVPRQISNLNLFASVDCDADMTTFRLQRLTAELPESEFVIKEISLSGELDKENIKINHFRVQTAQNDLAGSFCYKKERKSIEELSLYSESFNTGEYQKFIPIKLLHYPLITTVIKTQDDSLQLSLIVDDPEQYIELKASLNKDFSFPVYSLELMTSGFNSAFWVDNVTHTKINCKIILHGENFKQAESSIKGLVYISDSSFSIIQIDSLSASFTKSSDNVAISADYSDKQSSLRLNAIIDSIFSHPHTDLSMNLANFNLAPVTNRKELFSDLNLTLNAVIATKNSTIKNASVSLKTEPSSLAGIAVTALETTASYSNHCITVDTLIVETSFADLSLSGKGDLKKQNNLSYSIQLQDASALERALHILTPKDIRLPMISKGSVEGKLEGSISDFTSYHKLNFANIVWGDVSLGEVAGDLQIDRKNSIYRGELKVNAENMNAEDFLIRQICIEAKGTQKSLISELKIISDSLSLYLTPEVTIADSISLIIPEIRFQYKNITFNNRHEAIRLHFNPNSIFVENLSLYANEQKLSIQGIIRNSLIDESSLDINLKDIDLRVVQPFLPEKHQIHGTLNSGIKYKGKLLKPELKASINLSEPGWNEFELDSVLVMAAIKDNLIRSDLSFNKDNDKIISLTADIPVDFTYLTSRNNSLITLIRKDEPLNIKLAANGFDLAKFSNIHKEINKMSGLLNLGIEISNTFNQPLLTGEIGLVNGSLQIKKYGISYPLITMKAYLKNRTILLDTLSVYSGKGKLMAKGELGINDFFSGFSSHRIDIQGNDFLLANRKEVNLLTDVEISLIGDNENSDFSGEIDVISSRFDLEYLLNNQSSRKEDEPMLISAKNSNQSVKELKTETKKSYIPDRFRGRLKLNIPRNTWIKDDNMNIEISGNIEVVKQSKDWEIFGNVTTVRGTYEIYGKKFVFKEGNITFNGGKTDNPYISVTIEYVFRDIYKEKRSITLTVRGEALKPELGFLLDGEITTEANVISYLFFGKSNDQMSQGEKSQVFDEKTNLNYAKNLISRQLGKKLANSLGEKLGLDVVEFSGGESWKDASLLVGKYLTTNLFMSYQKEFSISQSKEFVPEKISLEYEINKHFFLQATKGTERETGLDLIIKFMK